MESPTFTALRQRGGSNRIDEYEFVDFGSHDDHISRISLDLEAELRRPPSELHNEGFVSLLSNNENSNGGSTGIAASRRTTSGNSSPKHVRNLKSQIKILPMLFLNTARHLLSLVLVICRDHNPFNASGRRNLCNLILRSGPAYQLPTSMSRQDSLGSRYTGWRMGALLNLLLLIACLVTEIVMLAVAEGKSSANNGVLIRGNCQTTKRLITPIALLVNVIATITIGSSNYMMQCFSAPTGTEVSEAHSHGNFLRIGVSSPLNIDFVSKAKTTMWWIMGITSVPVHLLFNSAFYSTLQANNYAIALVTSDFQDNAVLWSGCSNATQLSWAGLACDMYSNLTAGKYSRMERTQCITEYSAPILSKFSNVILVSTLNSTQRNASLTHFWANEVKLENSTFNFTKYRSTSGDFDIHAYDDLDPVVEYGGVLGIFTAFQYGSWTDQYRSSFNWVLDGSNISSVVANATLTNGTHYSGSVLQDIVLGNRLAVNRTLTVTLTDGVKLFGNVNSTTSASGVTTNVLVGSISIRPSRPSFDPTSWLCSDNVTSLCTKDIALESSERRWQVSPFGIPIDYCLAESVDEEKCEIKYSVVILSIVIGCESIKILIIALALRSYDEPLVTIGDVIAYFMQRREPLTQKRCLLSEKVARAEAASILFTVQSQIDFENDPCWSETCFPIDFSLEKARVRETTIENIFYNALPKAWEVEKLRWLNAVSRIGWGYLYIVVLCALGSTATVFASGVVNLKTSGGGSIWSRGLFSPDPNAVFTGTASSGTVTSNRFIQQVMLVNSPQLFFSLLYFSYNGAFTVMHSAKEWSDFAIERKPLRVSAPRPGQRSSYWLNLPWSYSLPLIVVSALLHWMVSRSLYLVNINVYGPYNLLLEDQTIFACGFSIVMLLLVFVLLIIMMATISGFSLRPLRGDIPMIGANSLAISSVCHDPDFSEAETRKPLLWGVTKQAEGDEPGHCALSSAEVEKPLVGKKYW